MTTTLNTVADRELTYDDILAQIRAEIGSTFKGNVSAFARASGINRTQLVKYLDEGRVMDTMKLMHMISTLGLTEGEFFKRARERAGL